MQVIEVSLTGVRSSVLPLGRSETPMRFVLFPMIHLGMPDFYESVAVRLGDCRMVVAEGVGGRSVIASALTLAYRMPGHSRRLGLTVQRIDYASLGIPVIRPDITARQLRQRWRSVPAMQRLAVWCLVPPFALALRRFGTRRVLSRYLDQTDLPTREEEQLRQAARELTELILDHRDALLVQALATIHETRHSEPITVAVVYGAGHVPFVTHELLRRYGYRPRTAEWLTVFDF